MALNAFESVRPRGAVVGPVAKKAPRAGWWKTRKGMSGAEWRWWDGAAWSWPVASNAGDAAIAKAMRPWLDAAAIVWCWDWPDGARVPRIDPLTGVCTGGGAK